MRPLRRKRGKELVLKVEEKGNGKKVEQGYVSAFMTSGDFPLYLVTFVAALGESSKVRMTRNVAMANK